MDPVQRPGTQAVFHLDDGRRRNSRLGPDPLRGSADRAGYCRTGPLCIPAQYPSIRRRPGDPARDPGQYSQDPPHYLRNTHHFSRHFLYRDHRLCRAHCPAPLRILTWNDYRNLLPLSLLGGALMLTVSDILARVLLAPQEIPVGVITAVTGAPFFLWILNRSNQAKV